jgi:hypothetical protein
MNKTLENVQLLEKQLTTLELNVKHKSTLYSDNSDEVIEAAKALNTHLYYPHPDSKECYWFVYKSKSNPRVSIRVKGPIL